MTYFFLVLTTSLWGSLYVVTKVALVELPPVTLLFWRYLFASVTLFVVVLTTKRKLRVDRNDVLPILFVGGVGSFLGVGLQVWGTKYGGASLASLVNSLNPVFISLFAAAYLSEKLSVQKIVSILLGLVGVYLIVAHERQLALQLGVLFSLLSVLFWSASSVVTKKLSTKIDPLILTFYGVVIATVFCIPASLIEQTVLPVRGPISVPTLVSVVFLGTLGTALPNVLWNRSLSRIDAGVCALFYPIQPLVSIILGVLFLHEVVSLSFFLGAGVVLLGLFFGLVPLGQIRRRWGRGAKVRPKE